MYQFLADNVDQLDLALDQLAMHDRNFDRFAFMLVDNAVELVIDGFIRDRASENELWVKIGKPKHDPKIIEKALRQEFDTKVKAASKLGLFDETVSESILNLHSFRNSTYHGGQRHDQILHSLAIFYFRTACKVLLAYRPSYWMISSTDVISFRARKYLGIKPQNHEDTFENAYKRLDEIASTLGENLIDDLSKDMASTIGAVNENIRFIAENHPDDIDRKDVAKYSQAFMFAFTEEAQQLADKEGYKRGSFRAYVMWLKDQVRWQINSDPISAWQARLARVSKETNYDKALKRYCDFMRQTERTRLSIEEVTVSLDIHIQQMIDIARGK